MMFERFRKEVPELQLYGKLPLAKDYLRVGASRGPGRELRDWLDHAFSSRAVDGRAPSMAWPARFVLAGARGQPLVGGLWPSSDTGGERNFPFAMFLARRHAVVTRAFEDGLAELGRSWRYVADCHAACAGFSDGHGFLSAMRGRCLPVEESSAPGQPIAWDTWLAALWPERGQDGLIELLVGLAQLRRPGVVGPLRLPLVTNLPLLPQVHAWWSALVALGFFAEGAPPTTFFPFTEPVPREPAFAVFLTSSLRHQDARWMGSPRTIGSLGQGDFARGRPALAPPRTPVPAGAGDLVVSMRGALLTARARC